MKKAMCVLLATAVVVPLLSACRQPASDSLPASAATADSAASDAASAPASFDFNNYSDLQLVVHTDTYRNWGAAQYVKVFLNKDPRQALYLGQMNREKAEWTVTVSPPKGAVAMSMESYDELGDTVEIDLTGCLVQPGVCYVQ